jgi:hypothetical protein
MQHVGPLVFNCGDAWLILITLRESMRAPELAERIRGRWAAVLKNWGRRRKRRRHTTRRKFGIVGPPS